MIAAGSRPGMTMIRLGSPCGSRHRARTRSGGRGITTVMACGWRHARDPGPPQAFGGHRGQVAARFGAGGERAV